MGLTLYKKKRRFDATTEPTGGVGVDNFLRFVVQKHAASHLHYDFRLEMDGVLKSWAVPKGPSMDPEVKRLAMMVEDHPYDYKDFEGIIPEGNYGAGTVIVWDEGSFTPEGWEGGDKKAMEKQLRAGLKKNKLTITLHGKKLRGTFALVKTHTGAENAWLLIKVKDRFSSTKDITLKSKSVISGKTIEQMKKAAAHEWSHGKAVTRETTRAGSEKATPKVVAKEKPARRGTTKTGGKELTALLETCPRAAFPRPFKPMLATRAAEAFDGDDWIYEVKWDGYRAVAYLHKKKVAVFSRNLLSFNDRFPSVVQALSNWEEDVVIDGEVVALDKNGQPSFQLLQNRQAPDRQFAYYVFDIVWYRGHDLTGLTLLQRKKVLEHVLPADDPVIRYSSHVAKEGKGFFDVAVKHGLEGVMAKKTGSAYTKNHRTVEWLKIKNDKHMEAVICGFTRPRNSRSYFGAVILGKYEGDKLVYIGHSGSGFSEAGLADMHRRFKPLIRKTCPFEKVPKTNMPVTWLQPSMVCEVKFTERTADGILRHPIFIGLREDKKAVNEKNEKVVKAPTKPAKKTSSASGPVKKRKGEAVQLSSEEKEQVVTVAGHELKFTNLTKSYWPKEKLTKRDLLNYYGSMAPYIMPYMKDRPQSLNRHPDGITKPGFYHKNMPDTAPSWIDIFPYTSDSDHKKTNYLVCRSEADLLYMASLGCIEMNPWHSRVPDVDHPDWCVIDLDPDTNTFQKVIETANVVKDVLDSIGADSYVKTSGSTGMHIYIPLGAKYTYDQSRMLAQWVVQVVQRELPRFTSIERSPAKRKGKIYLDYLQNKTTQTIAAPYSLRPRPGATVSTPLNWEEVKSGLRMKDHTIHTIAARVKEVGDIFKPVLGKGIDLKKVLKKIEALENA